MANYNMNQWMKEADEEAKKYQEQIKTNNQQVLDTLTNAKNNALSQLESQQNNALYNLNTNKGTINANAEDNAKQLYVNKLLALKQNEQAMNRAGLGTQGIVGSQVNSINNNYGTNLSNVLTQKASDLNALEKEKKNTIDSYAQSKLDLTNKYDTSYSDALTSINDKAQQQYNTIYQNYLAMKQNEYAAAVAKEEADRQYALNVAQMNSGSGGFDFGGDSTINIVTDYYNGPMTGYQQAAISKYGAFNTVDKNGIPYQPKGVIYNGRDYGRLTSSGKTVGQATGNPNYPNSSGVVVGNQTLWKTSDGQYWIWNGSTMSYEPIIINNTNTNTNSKNKTTAKTTGSLILGGMPGAETHW